MTTTIESNLPALTEAGQFRAGPVDVRTERILRIQGYRDMAKVRRPIRRAADKAAAIARDIAEGEVGFRRAVIAACNGSSLELGKAGSALNAPPSSASSGNASRWSCSQ